MTLYEEYKHGLDITLYCEKAYDILMSALEFTKDYYGYDEDYISEAINFIFDTGKIDMITRTEGVRNSVTLAFNGNNDLIDKELFSMVMCYSTLPIDSFLEIYSKKTDRTLNRDDSRLIKSATTTFSEVHEYLDCKTTTGLIRPNNEDFAATIISPINENIKLLVVCDGMGGIDKGEVASAYVTEKLVEWFNKFDFSNGIPGNIHRILRTVIDRINYQLKEYSYNSGTTLTAALIGEDMTYIINIGDSRAYKIKNDELNQLTTDDSQVWSSYYKNGDGEYTKDELRFIRTNNIITDCLGGNALGRVQIHRLNSDSYDALLLTTDGITDIVSDSRIIRLYNECNYDEFLDTLLEEACYCESEFFTDRKEDITFCSTTPGKDNATAAMYLKLKK